MKVPILVFLLLCAQEIVPQNSREARSVNIPVSDSALSMLTFDPVTSTLSRYVHSLCSSIGCGVQETQQRLEDWMEQYISSGLLYSFTGDDGNIDGEDSSSNRRRALDEDLFEDDENYFSHLEGGDRDGPWLLQSDSLTKRRYRAEKKEAMLLQDGRAAPRSYCQQSSSALQQHQECKFARVAAQHHINETAAQLANATVDEWEEYFTFGEHLFNFQLYSHSQGWIYFLMRNMDKSFNVAAYSIKTYHELMIRGSLVIAEISKLKGDWQVSFLYSLRMLRSHEMISASQQQSLVILGAPQERPIDNSFRLFVFRLRALLTVPPTPPPHSVARVERRNMIEDLFFLMRLASDENVRIPLQVSSHSEGIALRPLHSSLLTRHDRELHCYF